MDINRLHWQQKLRALALQGLTCFPTLPMWLNGQSAEHASQYYATQGEKDHYEEWCRYIKGTIFQGVAIQDYDEWKTVTQTISSRS
ncbi:MAG: hypothetical protein ACO3NK_12145 [Prochlorotrichaceae cyanobacterium]|jgi:hypothetical protein